MNLTNAQVEDGVAFRGCDVRANKAYFGAGSWIEPSALAGEGGIPRPLTSTNTFGVVHCLAKFLLFVPTDNLTVWWKTCSIYGNVAMAGFLTAQPGNSGIYRNISH